MSGDRYVRRTGRIAIDEKDREFKDREPGDMKR